MFSREERDKLRFTLLASMIQETGWDQHVKIYMPSLLSMNGIDSKAAGVALQFLESQGLIVRDVGLLGDPQGVFRITQKGIEEYERAEEHPADGTKLFPALNIFHIHTMTASNLMVGSPGSTQHLLQTNYKDPSGQQLFEFLQQAKALVPSLGLSFEDTETAIAEIEIAESQIKSPRPRYEAIAGTLRAFLEVTKSAAESPVFSPVVNGMKQFLQAIIAGS